MSEKYLGENSTPILINQIKDKLEENYKVMGELGAKNLIPYPYLMTTKTNNGVTITDNGDGTLTVNGTAQTAIFFNLCNIDFGDVPIGSANSEYIMSDGVDHSLNLEVGYNPRNKITSLNIWQGAILDNVTVYPMVRYKSDTDDTWTPYIPTNKTLKQELNTVWATQGKLGSKNLLKYPYVTPTPATYAGITYSDSEDGGIIINGTSTAYSILQIVREANVLPHGEYILSTLETLPSGVQVQFGYVTQGETTSFITMGYNNTTTPSMKVTIDDAFDGNLINIRIGISAGITVDNLVVHSMLRYASDTDNTWQPYAKTNYELTQNINDLPIRSGEGDKSAIIGDSNNAATGSYSFAGGRDSTSTGNTAIAIGIGVRATGTASFAEGTNTQASGNNSHAEGDNSKAAGFTSHAEGNYSVARGSFAHAEGRSDANGAYSHTQNYNTIAENHSQTAIGKNNDNKSTTLFEVGNGADANNRSNAFEVYSDGSLSTDNGTTKVKLEDVVTYTTNQHILDFTDSNAHKFGANSDQYFSYTLNRYDNKIILSQNNISISSSSADKLWIYRIFELLDITTLLNKGCIIELDITNSNVTSDNCLKLNKIVFSSSATAWSHAVNIINDIPEYNYNIVNNKIIIDIDTLYNRYKTQIESNVLPYSDNIYLLIGGELTITTVVDNEYKYNTPTTITIQGVYTLSEDRKQALNNYYTKQESDNRFQTKSINNIVCWGDSLTAMNGWTQTLQELSGINVYNAGTGGETSQTIMARQGGDVMIVDNIIIPSTTTAVTIASRSSDGGINTELGNVVTPLLQSGVHVNPVIIDNIKGNLTWTGSSGSDMNGTWTFTRLTSGDELVINRPTAIRTNFDINHNNNGDLMIIFMGQNGGWSSNDELIRQHKLMIDHFKGKEYIILGLSSGSADSRASYESAMKQAFGRRFISLREYLAHPIYDGNGNIISCYGLADQNLEPSIKEYNGVTYVALDEIAQGIVPHQLLIDSVHYTEGTREVIGKMLYKKLVELNIL